MSHWGIMLVLCVSSFIGWQDTPKHHEAGTHAGVNHAAPTQEAVPPPSPVVIPPAASPQSKPIPTPAEQSAQPGALHWFLRPEWVIVWITVAYTIITGLTLIAIKRQADLMAAQLKDARSDSVESAKTTQAMLDAYTRQAASMEKQASLVREQMDTEIHRQRARLHLEIQPIFIWGADSEEDTLTPDDGFNIQSCIEITNIGHSNAFIRNGAVRFVLVGSGAWPVSPVSPEDFTPGSDTVEPSQNPIYAPIESDYIPLSLKKFAEDILDETRRLRLYGYIEYESLGIRWHRDFEYVWTIYDPTTPDIPDPKDITFRHPKNRGELCVVGWWDKDLQGKNTEYRQNQ